VAARRTAAGPNVLDRGPIEWHPSGMTSPTPDVEPLPPGAGARDGAGLLFIFGVGVVAVLGVGRMLADGIERSWVFSAEGAAHVDLGSDGWLWVAAVVMTLSTAGVLVLVAREYREHRRFTIGVAIATVALLVTAATWWLMAAA